MAAGFVVAGGVLEQFAYGDCLKNGVSVLASVGPDGPGGPLVTSLIVALPAEGGGIEINGDCIFTVSGNPLALPPGTSRSFPIGPGGASAPSGAAAAGAAQLAAATGPGEIDGFTFGRNDPTGAFVAEFEVSGLTPLAIEDFISIITDSRDFATRFENLFDGDDSFTGGALADVIVAGAGNDAVAAGGGDDVVHKSRAGNLQMNGGAGLDTLAFRAFEGQVFPTPFVSGALVDLAAGTGTNPYGGALTLTEVENLIGTSLTDTLRGDGGANVFGDGQFDGGADVIDGRGGDDTVKLSPTSLGVTAEGGAGTDTLFFQANDGLLRLDLTDQSRNAGIFANGTFSGFERFERGTDFLPLASVFEFLGDGAAQTVRATSGDTIADLGGGNDILELNRSSGSLAANGGAGTDELRLLAGFGATVLDLENPAANSDGLVGAAISGFERFVAVDQPFLARAFVFRGDGAGQFAAGDSVADDLDGRGGDDTLSGGAGNDTLTGGAGSDSLIGGAGADLAVFAGALVAHDLSVVGGALRIVERATGDVDIVAADVETLRFAGVDFAFAALSGGVAPEPGAGPTTGDDALNGTTGSERIAARGGDDTVRGRGGDDTLLGQGGDDVLRGGGGDDNLKGGGGADRMFGQGGDDTMNGGGAGDFLKGGGGADRIIGGGGVDTIEGGKADDTLKGGGGADLFRVKPGDGDDVIQEFQQGRDLVEFKSGVPGFAALSIEQRGDDVLVTYNRGSILFQNQNAGAFTEDDFLF